MLPNQALTFRSYSGSETERLLVRLSSLPDGWELFGWPLDAYRVKPTSADGSQDHQDVSIYGPRVSETDMALLMKLGNCVRYMEFEDDAPF